MSGRSYTLRFFYPLRAEQQVQLQQIGGETGAIIGQWQLQRPLGTAHQGIVSGLS
jgi:hypothetical protein